MFDNFRWKKLTNESVMCHIEGCIVQGGDVVSFRGRPLDVSTHLVAASIFRREIFLLLSSVEKFSCLPHSVSLCRLIRRSLSSYCRRVLLFCTLCLFASLAAAH